MSFWTMFIRGLVKKNPEIKLKLKKAGSKQTPFQYINQSVAMSIMSAIAIGFIAFPIFKSNLLLLLVVECIIFFIFTPLFYKFWVGVIDVQITKYGRTIDSDLLFVSEYFLVSLESGLPLGNVIQGIAEIDRPGGRFFKRIYTDFKTGKDLEAALNDAISYAPAEQIKILLKRLADSLKIGVDLKEVLANFIEESSQKKVVEIQAFSKKLNPKVMMYLLLGIVVPSLGITFLILGLAVANPGTPALLKYILIGIFLFMFLFQYIFYSSFKFAKNSL
ncbi:MAG: type II secretion system F family protein [Nanoarchaeota archaeon]|nr:type II secretion system F family protein [Nanoarchaeota archaeon]